MTKQRSFAVTLFSLLSTSAALHTALVLVAFREAPIADHLGLAIWWLFLAVYQFVMTKYLQAPRELRSIVILSAVFVIAQLGVTIRCAPIFPSFSGWAAAFAMWIATYYRCANAILGGVTPEALMVNFETTAMTLLFSAVVVGLGAMVPGVLIHLCISLFLILIAMMRQRTLHTRIDTQNRESTTTLLLPLILLGIAALVVVFCIIISGSAADILTQITAWLSRLLTLAVDLIGAFLFWFFSLFPQPKKNSGDSDFYAEPLPAGQQEQVTTSNGIILYLLIIAVVVGLIFCVVKIWRTVHLRGRSVKLRTVNAVVVKKNSLWETIKRFWNKLSRKIRFNLHYLSHRNTAPGLLVWIEWQMRRKRMKRKHGETASAFLTRVGNQFPLCQTDLQALAKQLDRYYFGLGDDLPPETIRKLRKQLKHAFSNGANSQEKKSHS